MSSKYERLRGVAVERYNDKSMCGVIALAIAAGVSYGKAHAVLGRAGRKNRGRTQWAQWEPAAAELGFRVELETLEQRKTIRKFAEENEGMTLAFTRGHVAAVEDTIVHDWTKGRNHRVFMIGKLIPVETLETITELEESNDNTEANA